MRVWTGKKFTKVGEGVYAKTAAREVTLHNEYCLPQISCKTIAELFTTNIMKNHRRIYLFCRKITSIFTAICAKSYPPLKPWQTAGIYLSDTWRTFGRAVTDFCHTHGTLLADTWQGLAEPWQTFIRRLADRWQSHGRRF